MTIALTPFYALCGFRPIQAIAAALTNTPEFSALIPNSTLDRFVSFTSSAPTGPSDRQKAALKEFFSALMTTEDATCKRQLTELVDRYSKGQIRPNEDKELAELVLRLDSQFPGDIGVWCAFVLNYVKMDPGEAMFLGAGEPHCYVAGGVYVNHAYIIHLVEKIADHSIINHRVYGMHGKFGQCHSRWADPKTERRSEPRRGSDIFRHGRVEPYRLSPPLLRLNSLDLV